MCSMCYLNGVASGPIVISWRHASVFLRGRPSRDDGVATSFAAAVNSRDLYLVASYVAPPSQTAKRDAVVGHYDDLGVGISLAAGADGTDALCSCISAALGVPPSAVFVTALQAGPVSQQRRLGGRLSQQASTSPAFSPPCEC